MKRTIPFLLTLTFAAPAFAFEQTMHLFLAMEAMQHLTVGGELFAYPPEKEIKALEGVIEAYGKKCDAAQKKRCDAVRAAITRLRGAKSPRVAPGKPVSVFFPMTDKKPPYEVAKDGLSVAAPFQDAIEGLGMEEFLRNFLSGVLGADNFPDFFSGALSAHMDQSRIPFSFKNMFGIEIDVEIPEIRLWKSWQWGMYVFKQARNPLLFERIAKRWPENRPYWGKKYTKADLQKRLQREAIAFAYGYWVHMAQDAVAHEMVSSMNGGAFWIPNLITPNKLVERRHSAVEGYMLAKARPYMWRYAETLSDLKVPVPFIREVLMMAKGVTQAPTAVHLLALNKLPDLFKYLYKECKTEDVPRAFCAGKEAPAVYSTLHCATKTADAQGTCLGRALCQFVRRAFLEQKDEIRDAMDGWILLSLAIARAYGADTFHRDVQLARKEKKTWPSLTWRYREALREYGLKRAVDAGYAAGAQEKSLGDYTGEAIRVYTDQFLIPALVPVRIVYSEKHEFARIEPAEQLMKQVDIDCAYMGFTNMVAVCELAKRAVVTAVLRVAEVVKKLVADNLQGVFDNATQFPNYERPAVVKAPEKPEKCSPTKNGRALPNLPDYSPTPDVAMNALYPCKKGDKCADCGATEDVAENPTSRELKRRLERFVGVDAAKKALKREWEGCAEKTRGTGDSRTNCFNEKVFTALAGGQLGVGETPPHASPWVRRAIVMTLLGVLSDGGLKSLVAAPREFAERAACERKVTSYEGGARTHLLEGVLASLHCINRDAKPKLENGYYDELSYGKFPLYDAACAPLKNAILPAIPDSDGDGLNDVYDTCPDMKCEAGFQPDPDGNHVGKGCTAATRGKFCIVEK